LSRSRSGRLYVYCRAIGTAGGTLAANPPISSDKFATNFKMRDGHLVGAGEHRGRHRKPLCPMHRA
jgi:hypothetical protein